MRRRSPIALLRIPLLGIALLRLALLGITLLGIALLRVPLLRVPLLRIALLRVSLLGVALLGVALLGIALLRAPLLWLARVALTVTSVTWRLLRVAAPAGRPVGVVAHRPSASVGIEVEGEVERAGVEHAA